MWGFASFGQPFNNSIFGRPNNSSLGTTTGFNQAKPFSFGTQNAGFGFSNQSTGSRRAAYAVTRGDENTKFLSLSAMEVYSAKSHEELRFEDYNAGDKGGIAKSSSSFSTVAPQKPSNPFPAQTTSNLFTSQTSSGFASTQTTNSNPFQSSSGLNSIQTTNSNPFQSSSGLFTTQTTNGNPFQSSSGLFTTQTTNTNSFQSNPPRTSFSPFPNQSTPTLTSQTSTNPFALSQPQTSFNGFNSQTSSSLFPFPSQTTSSIFPLQTNSNPFPSHTTSSIFPSQTNSNPFPSQITSSIFPSQTNSNPFRSQTTSSIFPSQTNSNPFLQNASSSIFPSQPNSNAFPNQTTSSIFPSQTNSIAFPSQTTSSIFPSQTNSNPFLQNASSSIFPSQPNSNAFPNQTTSSIFPSQTNSIAFPNQTTSSIFPSQTNSNPFPSQTNSFIFQSPTSPNFFPTQTTSNPNPLQTSSGFSFQTSPNLLSTQTTSNPFPSQTTSIYSPQTTSNAFTSQTGPILSPAQPSVNAFATNSFGTFSNQTSTTVPASNFSAFNKMPLPTTPSQIIGLQPTTVIGSSISSQGPPASLSTAVDQPVINRNPFGELPAVNHLTISQTGPTISVQYGISSMPVQNKPPAAVRLSSSLTSRHLSHSRMRSPARKYDSKTDSPKVPFFSRDKENPMRASILVPRDNPRAFVLSAELWRQRSGSEEVSPGVLSENNTKKEPDNVVNINLAVYEPDHHEAEISNETDEIKGLMPQLSIPDYYTKPPINQMAEKEMEEAGFCSCVKDFEIGRYGYGNIKFLGETDVRKLCLDSLVEFNNREVVVYKDENEKPPVDEGLNKQAEVTLLNIHCVDKKTRQKYVDGPKVEKYKEMLKKKGEEQGAEFISFDAVKGEWKFRVQHF